MLENILLGKLSLAAIPGNPIILGAGAFMALIGLMIVAALFYFKKWTWLWREWITTVDHKKIGVMYIILAFVMLLRGFTDAIMMRLQHVMAVGGSSGYLEPEHYDQIFTAHGVIMIFFMAMPFMFGLINIVLPLQIGARDVAYPFLNSLSFWLAVAGAMLINVSLVVGDFAATGWLAYPPLSELAYSPGVGVDYYIWALQVSGIGSLLSGINFIVTVLKMRCPGMTMMRMPVFAWTALCSMLLVVLSFPVLTATLFLLSLDRLMGMHFFTADFGGNAMMYINMIWIWGHPEVYILILPSFGIFSEIVATFCKKKLFGYKTMVWATASITILSFVVWLHHFFTMGAGANVNAFFGIATMVIAIPTGAKVFNWLFTMFRGRISYTSPMIWALGFMSTFVIGGMTGVLMAIPAVDFQFHNSLFLVAHFHNVIIGGVVFGYLAGLTYWFPKVFGFSLDEKLGKLAAWLWIGGFYVAFMPIYVLGLMGVTRRLNYYYDGPEGWYPLIVISALGALMIGLGVFTQIAQLLVSIKNCKALRDITGDPWNARTLEWSIPSPAPFYNFAITPQVDSLDAFWEEKQKDIKKAEKPEYQPIHMPKNTAVGFVLGVFGFVFSFAFTWHIYWMVAASLLGIASVMIIRSFNLNTDYYVTTEEVTQTELQHTQVRA